MPVGHINKTDTRCIIGNSPQKNVCYLLCVVGPVSAPLDSDIGVHPKSTYHCEGPKKLILKKKKKICKCKLTGDMICLCNVPSKLDSYYKEI